MTQSAKLSKKDLILAIAADLDTNRFTPAEVEQIRRQMVARVGAAGKATSDYVMSVLQEAGLRVVRSTRSDTEGRYEEEFHDLLHFATLEEAEMCIVRLDELWRKFREEGDAPAVERALEVGRLGRRRAEMIARNPKVEPHKRAEKEEILRWFQLWLETPESFFDWLEVRKQSSEFQTRFAASAGDEA